MTETVFKPIKLRMIIMMILVPYGLMAYPVFGMKRYGRSTTHPQGGWGMSSMMHVPSYYYQALPRPQPQPQPQPQTYHPYSYYDAMSLYAPEYDDYYYPQESQVAYPFYYPISRAGSNNYDFYQPFVPYYYSPNPYTYYDSPDPMEDLQEEVLQEEEREQREEAYPIGQETWYEPDDTETHEDSIDDVNAAFMKNLMLYNNAMAQPYVYGKVQSDTYPQQYGDLDNWNTNPYNSDDKDEEELHMLTEAPKKQKPKTNKKQSAAHERMEMFNSNNNRNQKNRYDPNNSESWLKNKRTNTITGKEMKYDMSFTSRKPQKVMGSEASSTASSTSVSPTSTQATRDARGGQKEVMMIRPATPVRRPFSEPVMQLLAQQGGPERKRTPSVYDTIKHMLEMEKNLEKEYRTQDYYRPAMRKRYVSSEESLVEELAGLKKTA